MVFPPTDAVRVAPAPQEAGKGGGAPGPTVKGGAPGKVWLKAKPVNGMAALLVMVNVRDPAPVKEPPEELRLTGPSEVGLKAMVKVGAGTVTVRLIAAAVALSPWLLLRSTAGLVRDPAVVAVT
jgi:hypothetical protein